MNTGQGREKYCGRGRWRSNRCDGGGCRVRDGRSGGWRGGDLDLPYNTWNDVVIWEIYRYFRSADWDALQGDDQAYVSHQLSRAKAGGWRVNDGACGEHGRSENDRSHKLKLIGQTSSVEDVFVEDMENKIALALEEEMLTPKLCRSGCMSDISMATTTLLWSKLIPVHHWYGEKHLTS